MKYHQTSDIIAKCLARVKRLPENASKNQTAI